jgi:hypothetical protein
LQPEVIGCRCVGRTGEHHPFRTEDIGHIGGVILKGFLVVLDGIPELLVGYLREDGKLGVSHPSVAEHIRARDVPEKPPALSDLLLYRLPRERD